MGFLDYLAQAGGWYVPQAVATAAGGNTDYPDQVSRMMANGSVPSRSLPQDPKYNLGNWAGAPQMGNALLPYMQTGLGSPGDLSFGMGAPGGLDQSKMQDFSQQAQAPASDPQGSAPDQPQGIQGGLGPNDTRYRDPMNEGLMAAGAALMSNAVPRLGPNGVPISGGFGQGAGEAMKAFQDTANNRIDSNIALNQPRVTPLADGAFSMVHSLGQAPQVVPNGKVQDFLVGKTVLANQLAMNKVLMQSNLNMQRDQSRDDRKNADEYQKQLVQTEQAIMNVKRAQAALDQHGAGDQVAGMFPGVAGMFAPDRANRNLQLKNAAIDTLLAQGAMKSGALTQGQSEALSGDVPELSASRDVWAPFLQRRLEALSAYHDFQSRQVNKSNPTPTQGFSTQGTSNVPRSGGVLFNY